MYIKTIQIVFNNYNSLIKNNYTLISQKIHKSTSRFYYIMKCSLSFSLYTQTHTHNFNASCNVKDLEWSGLFLFPPPVINSSLIQSSHFICGLPWDFLPFTPSLLGLHFTLYITLGIINDI